MILKVFNKSTGQPNLFQRENDYLSIKTPPVLAVDVQWGIFAQYICFQL